MNRLNYWIRSYFGFSRSEANGMMILIPLVLLLLVSPYIYQRWTFKPMNNERDKERLDSLIAVLKENIYYDSVKQKEDFYAAYRYSNFNKKRFEKTLRNDYPSKSYAASKPKLVTFNVNLADTTMLKKIPGIGKVLSNRIVKYRESLGGFTSKGQLREIYGLKDSVLMALDTLTFIETDFIPSRLDVNSLDEQGLSKHPYISRSLAKSIIAYKFQHGELQSAADLKNIHLIDTLKLQQILLYLKFDH
jgi:competence protein ComEA